jgi:hypothetical protein
MTASTRSVPPKTGTTIANGNDGEAGFEGLYTGPVLVLLDDRARIDRILNRLDVAEDLTERADLASELVRAASRHEDVVERAVLPALEGRTNDGLLEKLATQRDELRQAMDYIHHRTQHLTPRNAHAGDPQGLEDAIDDVADRLTVLLKDEDAQVIGLVRDLDPPAKLALETVVKKALRHAAERPKPARTPIGRIASNIATKLDHIFEDASTPNHPGAETIDG